MKHTAPTTAYGTLSAHTHLRTVKVWSGFGGTCSCNRHFTVEETEAQGDASYPWEDGGRAGIQEAWPPTGERGRSHSTCLSRFVTKPSAQYPPSVWPSQPRPCRGPGLPPSCCSLEAPSPPLTQQGDKPTNTSQRAFPNLCPPLRWHCPLWRLKLRSPAPGLGWVVPLGH